MSNMGHNSITVQYRLMHRNDTNSHFRLQYLCEVSNWYLYVLALERGIYMQNFAQDFQSPKWDSVMEPSDMSILIQTFYAHFIMISVLNLEVVTYTQNLIKV